ncbi:MAG: hypothetical protein O2963_03895, partial [Proteobacteria bacterium]|nr:hypothetical protein [Pseudomonadota bacterium]
IGRERRLKKWNRDWKIDLINEFNPSGDDLYDKAVAIVARDQKASTSYIQRQLQIGYNRAANIIDKMEREGVVSSANHVGKRDVLIEDHGKDY